ncbi:MAG: MFS transporter [Myxococcales bacterium]|nr:MFS transporter [Myxococcales bacterium]
MSRPPLVTRAFGLLVAGHFLQAVGYSSMLLLPLYLAALGATRAQVGGAMAVASIGGLVLRPPAGWAIDAVGRRPTVVAGTLSLAVGSALLVGVTSIGPLLWASRLLVGVGAGTLFTVYFAFAADVIPASRRTEGIALFGVSGLAPLAVNPLVGDLNIAPLEIRWIYPVIAGLVLLSMWPALRVPEPDRPTDGAGPPPASVLATLGARPLWSVWAATTTFSGMVALFMAFATVAAADRGVPDAARLWYGYAGAAVAVRLVGAGLPDRVGPVNMVTPALAAYVAAALLIAQVDGPGPLLLAGVLAGVGHGYCFPVLTAQVITRAPANRRGAAMAGFTALWEVTALALPPLFGLWADRHDDATMFATAAVMAVLGLVAWVLLEHRAVPAQAPRPEGANP